MRLENGSLACWQASHHGALDRTLEGNWRRFTVGCSKDLASHGSKFIRQVSHTDPLSLKRTLCERKVYSWFPKNGAVGISGYSRVTIRDERKAPNLQSLITSRVGWRWFSGI